MCPPVPMPIEPKLSLPGFAFACATSSASPFTGSSAFTRRRNGYVTVRAIGSKSLRTSKVFFAVTRGARITWLLDG